MFISRCATRFENIFGVNKFSLFNSECINHTNHLFTRTIAKSDIALLNVINKELNIITTLGMNKEHKLKSELINTNRIKYNTIILVHLEAKSKTQIQKKTET